MCLLFYRKKPYRLFGQPNMTVEQNPINKWAELENRKCDTLPECRVKW